MAAGVAFLVSGLSSNAGVEFFETIHTNDYFQNAPFHVLDIKYRPKMFLIIFLRYLFKESFNYFEQVTDYYE